MKKNFTRETVTGAVVILLSVLGIILFALGFSTGYYTYGQMNSGWITAVIIAVIVIECAAIYCLNKFPKAWWPKLLTFLVTAGLAFAALALIGDRVEGIGNCILTDYDSGHGGEEAIYMSLGGAVAWLAAMIFNIIGAFGKDAADDKDGKPALKWTLCGVGVVALIAILIPSLVMGGVFAPKAAPGTPGTATAQNGGTAADPSAVAGTYTVKLSGAEGNVDKVKDFQFQCGNLSGLMNYDTRLTLDLALTLNADGTYSLFSDGYAFEAGKRAVIGDDTGLGMISQMTAEGTYTVNDDGTVTTSPASHAVFELQLDTYSSQMRGPASYKLGDEEMADGKYDSADYPVILEDVPETVWTLSGSEIVSYAKPSGVKPGTYTVKLSGAEGNVDLVQSEQFQCGNLSGLMNYDTRLTLDLSLTLNADGTYSLFSDGYAFEAGKRAVIGDDTGLGMISQMTAEGTYTVNDDGTVTTSPASHAVFELALDTYSSQMRGPASYKLGDEEMADGKYDSADYPAILDRVPEAIWTLNGDMTIAAYTIPSNEEPAEEPAEQPAEPAAPAAEGVVITSDDGGTTLTFNPDGTYAFDFASYSIHEEGTYTYEGGKLTVTNENSVEAVGEGDPIALHYVSATSEQLTGDYTIPASTFDFGGAAPAAESVTIVSDDEGTKMVFNPDGTYSFLFESYNIEDKGTYTYEGGVLTLTDENGKQYTGEGDPIKLHYVYSKSEQLTGDYTIPASTFDFGGASPATETVITSDDGGTALTFRADGTFAFDFASYNIHEEGTYTYVDGKLTVTNANGLEAVGEGDPIKLHFVSATSEQLTGDYTIPASTFDFGGAAPVAFEPITVTSVDGNTTITFNDDGTYLFEFAQYGVQDPGTYTFENGELIVINANGLEMKVEDGKLHYISGVSDMLTGDFEIDAAICVVPVAFSFEPFTVVADDGNTQITFRPDGTFLFEFPQYGFGEEGTFTYADGKLTVINANGDEAAAEGAPLTLPYVAAANAGLVGDFTIDPAKFGSAEAAPAASFEAFTVVADDGNTQITFRPDGTFLFEFPQYGFGEEGTFTFADGKLTVVNANGDEAAAEGAPLALHYVAAANAGLVGDFTVDPAQFN